MIEQCSWCKKPFKLINKKGIFGTKRNYRTDNTSSGQIIYFEKACFNHYIHSKKRKISYSLKAGLNKEGKFLEASVNGEEYL
jgi:hypothetical protein